MNISRENLLKNGYEELQDQVTNEYYYHKHVVSNDDNIYHVYHINIWNFSNLFNRNWSIHIDNSDMQTVARVDVQTFEHIDKLFDLLDIKIISC